jgi:hypothetical protein
VVELARLFPLETTLRAVNDVAMLAEFNRVLAAMVIVV